MTYSFHPEAESEYLSQVAYYEEQRPGLGALFVSQFETAMNYICSNPYSHKQIGEGIHLVSMKIFPFNILYRVAEETVQILAMAHKRRRPGYWLSRLS